MTAEQITEGNKLIAEFMGYFNESMRHAERLKTGYKWQEDLVEINALKYHTSWDWLMPVVEKIGKLSPVRIDYNPFSIRISDAGIVFKHLKTPIDNVFSAVVSYIQWHNDQK